MTNKGVLLINLGTPDSCQPKDVKKYLSEFLNDERVVDLPALYRWILVNIIIIPFRYKKSAAAYQKIWSEGDSPLRLNSQELCKGLAERLGDEYQVEYGMRYGNPSIEHALQKLSSCTYLKIIPLFPQYSSAASGSAIEKTLSLIQKQWNIPSIEIINNFYNDRGFIRAYAEIINESNKNHTWDYLLFSYHGLPERQIIKSQCLANCNKIDVCPAIGIANQYCYRAQCYATTNEIITALKLSPENCGVAFQSRLGRTPWIKPYTDYELPRLIEKGVKKLAVVCPSFVSDCLETLEEVNLRTREQWLTLGGTEFVFIPCLNSSPLWIDALSKLC